MKKFIAIFFIFIIVTSCLKENPIEIHDGVSTLKDGRKINSLVFDSKKGLNEFYKILGAKFIKGKNVNIPNYSNCTNEYISINKDWYHDSIYIITEEFLCKNLNEETTTTVFLTFYDKNGNDILKSSHENYIKIKKYFNDIYFETVKTTSICNNQTQIIDKTGLSGTLNQNELDKETNRSKYYTLKDTIEIVTEYGDTIRYSKKEYNQIIDNHPELISDNPENPDKSYYCNSLADEFGSEVGQDSYYVLYAYFLKQKNGIETCSQNRNKLIQIYTNINSLFSKIEYGGTYFGHQHSRILGYAEYSVYLSPKTKDDIEKTYDITKQKLLYIKSLRQLIDDESKIDYETLGKSEKVERCKELNKLIDNIDKLITDNFFLRRAEEFHYGHYEYY